MEDLTGQQFGNWRVIEYKGKSEWLCECQCENHTRRLIRTYMLKSGGSKSCGCNRVTGQLKDLTGQQFGNWKVLEYAGHSKWLCECQCSNKTRKIVAGRDLKSGGTRSCGCLMRKDGKALGSSFDTVPKEKEKHIRVKEDLTGRQFGNWKVLKYVGNYKWQCECQCENHTIRDIDRYSLIKGKSTNCGCKRHKDLTGMTFGRLEVLKYCGNMIWECQCSCEEHNIVRVTSGNLMSGSTKSCGCLKNESRNSKEEYLEVINKYIEEFGDNPYIEDVARSLNIHRENARHNLIKYELMGYMNKYFGSHYEHDLYVYVSKFIDKYKIILHDRNAISPQELDIYIPEKHLAIEFNGDYWHSTEKLDSHYHQNKTIACAKKGIHLIHIFEYEWKDTDKQTKMLELIKSKLTTPDTILYARNTELKQVPDSEAEEFLNKYHLQGNAPATIKLGLYNDKELISILTFGAPRFNNNYTYEIIRYCNKFGVGVVGGIERLYKYFITTYSPESVITYSDISKFTGNVYSKIGFKAIQPEPLTEPGYVWINNETGLVMQRYQTQKQKLLKLGLGTKEQTEKEIMVDNGFIQVYNCGNIKMEWINENK